MISRGVCVFCRAAIEYQEQLRLDGGLDLVPVRERKCITRPGYVCQVETRGDRMVLDLAKRNSRRRGFRR